MTTKVPDHDLNHEVYLDPKDGKEHVNHGMLEYSKEDLEPVSYTHLTLPTIYSV